jgi:hypothetical protein
LPDPISALDDGIVPGDRTVFRQIDVLSSAWEIVHSFLPANRLWASPRVIQRLESDSNRIDYKKRQTLDADASWPHALSQDQSGKENAGHQDGDEVPEKSLVPAA